MVNVLVDMILGLHERGLTILLVEQNVGVAAALADSAHVLQHGEIVFSVALLVSSTRPRSCNPIYRTLTDCVSAPRWDPTHKLSCRAEAEVARIQAEAENKPFDYSGLDPDMALQGAIYAHRRAEFTAKVEGYARKFDELAAVISRSQFDAAGYRDRLGLAQTVEQMRSQLESRQVGSKLSTLAAMDSRTEMARSLANAQQSAEGARRNLAAMTAERDAYIQGWRADVSQKLSEATRKLSDTREQLNKAKLRRELVELRAEADATVQSVAKVSVGSVMQSGQHFITLVPADAPLEIEANIFGRENGFVHVGDPVAIKFDTFPYSQYGMAEGTVRIVSPDSFTAQDEARNPTSAVPLSPTSTEPFYRTRIAIDKVALHDVPAGFRVTPGMPVTADIKVGKRTVLSYLLGRIMPLASEGMREP